MDQSYDDSIELGELYGEGAFCFKPNHQTKISDHTDDSNFDCNICLELVQEPVVTLCGHLFCWPCIHKWFNVQKTRNFSKSEEENQCPVCKSNVSYSTLVPLYGQGHCTRGKTTSNVPKRPVYRLEMPNSRPVHSSVMSSNSLSYSPVLDPVMVMVGEMVATRLFGSRISDRFTYPDTYNLAMTSGPRMRRRVMQAEKSLGRIFFFLVCCIALCLLLF